MLTTATSSSWPSHVQVTRRWRVRDARDLGASLCPPAAPLSQGPSGVPSPRHSDGGKHRRSHRAQGQAQRGSCRRVSPRECHVHRQHVSGLDREVTTPARSRGPEPSLSHGLAGLTATDLGRRGHKGQNGRPSPPLARTGIFYRRVGGCITSASPQPLTSSISSHGQCSPNVSAAPWPRHRQRSQRFPRRIMAVVDVSGPSRP